ncbi:phosphate acetyltransferase [Bacteroidetes/Chlorobi group bacterium ChocPot_Mid]|jgi:phosphate acetyltransferase|nr:MAG: phosphate acetyltransferase [Bacteroidetes/Chlorobi group bacterium ChocPot_Mid]
MNDFINSIRTKAKARNFTVAFPDADDIRTLKASIFLKNEKIAQPVLVGNPEKIVKVANDNHIDISGITIHNPEDSELTNEFSKLLFEKRKSKGMTEEQATETIKDPLYFAGLLLETDRVKAVVGGNVSSTGNVMRAAIHTVGVAEGISIVSSFFVMVFPDKLLCFADCAVNPDPTEAQLADIAISSAINFKAVTGEEPRVAMLSFSTNGSAVHPDVEKVQNATKIVKQKAPEIPSDGEMQLDAAIIPSIGERKFPGSTVAGKANVLIFPDLNSGNIGYKLTERLAGAEAVGPIVQGLRKPYCDLSRGCSADDMVNVAAICTLMAKA